MQPRNVTPSFAVAPQIEPGDLDSIAAQGFTLLINNRPDGEDPGQPTGAEMAAAAQAAGLRYVAIPVSSGGFQLPQVDEMAKALQGTQGKTLAFCRSGTRSILLWALAEAKRGADIATVRDQVAAAGYSAEPILPTMEAIARDA